MENTLAAIHTYTLKETSVPKCYIEPIEPTTPSWYKYIPQPM